MNARWVPLAGFLLLFALLGGGVWYVRDHAPNELPSPLIGKSVPGFSLPHLYAPERSTDARALRGKPYVMHVFASWCYVCRDENALLMREGRSLGVKLIGFDYKDEPSEAKRWLQMYGDPYDLILTDIEGEAAIDFGVYGAPELFLVDGEGTIRYKRVGPLTPEVLGSELLPAIAALKTGGAR